LSITRPLEEVVLSPAEAVIGARLSALAPPARDVTRLKILAAAAAPLGGFSYEWFGKLIFKKDSTLDAATERASAALCEELNHIRVHHALVLSALARPELSHNERRSAGIYYTDFRLAKHLASPLAAISMKAPLILDPACGTGTLLVAAALALSEGDAERRAALLANSIYAADLSSRALVGAAIAISSLTGDQAAIASLITHLRQGDSLLEGASLWSDVAPEGFDVIIGNPPWEKLKVSRHEFLTANGAERHYGAEYEEALPQNELVNTRSLLGSYVSKLKQKFELQGAGEQDLYKLFLELSVRLTRRGGRILLLVPAGLIRSLGTRRLREFLMRACSGIEFSLLENRARFFAIDARFKFLVLEAQVANGHRRGPIKLTTVAGEDYKVVRRSSVFIPRSSIHKIRPDLSVPEVRSKAEWKIFRDIALNNDRLGDKDGLWQPAMTREVDMTLDSIYFSREEEAGDIPVIEGRMLHQYRHAAKQYVSGTGRRAFWRPLPQGSRCDIRPQFWFPKNNLPGPVERRVSTARVGFCDITGQTNERTMLAAWIPAGVVCGNKVPTISFGNESACTQVSSCWLAVANSLPFDWMLRRVVTTTVNFFILLDMPFPKIDPASGPGLRLTALVDALSLCEHNARNGGGVRYDCWAEAEIRAEIDWLVLREYGQGLNTMKTMLEDFPLLDRSQPAISGEPRSTITRDFLLLKTAEGLGEGKQKEIDAWGLRVMAAREIGAVPYVPSQLGLIE
jgi:methylase of polypeptide subunit release factors